MKKILFLMPLLSLVAASCNKSNRIPDLPEGLDLYRKEIRYENDGTTISGYSTYEYERNLLIKQTSYDEKDQPSNIYKYAYDDHGNLKTKIVEDPNEVETAYHEYDNEYDNQGRLTKETERYTYDHSEWFVGTTNEYIYDDHSITNKRYEDETLCETTILTFDNRDCLTNVKIETTGEPGTGREMVLTVDDYGCITSAIDYSVDEYKRGEIMDTMSFEYLDNLWYRPTKTVIEICVQEPHTYHTTIQEYDNQQRLILSKSFFGQDETQIPGYIYYNTYEY